MCPLPGDNCSARRTRTEAIAKRSLCGRDADQADLTEIIRAAARDPVAADWAGIQERYHGRLLDLAVASLPDHHERKTAEKYLLANAMRRDGATQEAMSRPCAWPPGGSERNGRQMRRVTWTQELATTIFTSVADVGEFHRLDPLRTFEGSITIKEVERILQAVLADVSEQRVALEAAVEKIYSGPALREALSVDLREMVIRTQEQHEFLSIRKEAGLKIDPATAEVTGRYTQILDPYGIRDLSPEEDCVGSVLFARAPGGDIWVSQCELPSATVDALRIRIEQEPDDLPF